MTMPLFIERLKELMSDTHSTQTQIAKEAVCGHSSVSRWINEQNYPTVKNLICLSNYFNCSIDFLLCRTDDPSINDIRLHTTLNMRLKELTLSINKTLHAISIDLQLDETILYRWARGKIQPTVPYLLLLVNYFDCTTDYLIGRN